MFLYVARVNGEWTIATRNGHLLTCDEDALPEGAPRLIMHPQCTVPTMPLAAMECPHCRPQPVHEDEDVYAGVPEGHHVIEDPDYGERLGPDSV